MSEDETKDKEPTEEQPVVEEKGTILSHHGYRWFVAITIFLLLLSFVVKTEQGVPALEPSYAVAIIMVLIAFEIIVRAIQMKTATPPLKMLPFDPETEIPELEEKFHRMGYNIQIQRWQGEPAYGSGSEWPHTMHFKARETFSNGLTRPLMFSMIMLSRSIRAGEPNHSHVENSDRTWADVIKYPKLLQAGVGRELVRPKLRFYEAGQKPVDGEEDEEKEEENGE